jgi:outer membrane protein OmpA-like peptidoglycan-associated protein
MTKTIPLLQMSLVMGLALGTSACQSLSDAASGVGSTVSSAGDAVGNVVSNLNPFGSSDDAAPPSGTMADAGASADTNAATTPDLSSIPAKPATSTPAQQQAAAQSLAADGAQARYSADSLRAGTEASAAPPTAADLAPPTAQASAAPPSASDAPPTASDAPPSAQPSATARTAAATPPPASTPSAALSQGTAAVPSAGAPPTASGMQTAALAPPSGAAASPVGPSAARTASAAPLPPGAEPAVPASTPMRGNAMVMGSQTATDAALGFRPSTAPPLNPSISQWVAPPILAHYRQTASSAGISLASNAAVPPKGAVMSDMDPSSSPIANSIAAMNGGIAPTAIIYFPGDGAALSAAARAQIRAAVSQYKATGGTGSIRVVGHASSRTPNMPVEKHLELIFSKSQARANAVAQELIHEGVPAAKVLVEAVGDSQPVYYESMPQGEDGNRRAEIFVQS